MLLILVGLSFVYSTEYGRERAATDGSDLCAPNCSDLRFLARDRNQDDNIYVLRDDAAFGNLRLAFGRVNPGTERVHKAAFAVSNEEPFPVTLNSVMLTGVAADWVTLTLHRSSNRFAAQDTGATLVIWDGPGADAPGTPHPFTWTLAAGDLNMATAGVLGEYAVAGPDAASFTRYISTPGPVQSITGAGANKDFVWVQVAVRVPPGTANALYSGDVQFVFNANPSGTTEFGRTQTSHNVQVARNWYLRDAYSCGGNVDIRGMAVALVDQRLYFAGRLGGGPVFCSYDTLGAHQGTAIAGLTVAQPRAALANPVDGRIYIAGDGRDFVAYDPVTGAFTDLEPALAAAGWPAGDDIESMTVDAAGNVYVGGDNRDFMRWNIAGGTATNLEPALAATGWAAGTLVRAMAFNPANGRVYVGGSDSNFVSVDPIAVTGANHEPVLVAAGWPAGEQLQSIVVDAAGLVYVGGLNRDFAVYRPVPNTATNLEPLLAAVGWGPGGADVRAMVYNVASNVVYLGGQNGEFARYNVGPGTVTDLQLTLSPFWGFGGGSVVNALAFDPLNAQVYLGGNGGRFAVHTPALGTGASAGDDLRGRRLLTSPPTAAVPTSFTDPVAVGTQQIADGANPTESWSQSPKFAVATPLAGAWTFSVYGCRSAAGVAGSIQARVFRISDDAILATSTGPALAGWPVCGGTGLLTWSPVLGAMPVIAAGDGFYVQVWVVITAAPGGASVTMRFDGAAFASGVVTP
jgi:hypothetical protein